MKYLKTALLEKYSESAALKNVCKHMYFIDRPASPQRPFALVTIVPGDHGYTSANRVDIIVAQFEIEGRTLEAISDAIEQFHLVFDHATLDYGDVFKHISIRRTNFDGPKEESGIWKHTMDYLIQRSKALET